MGGNKKKKKPTANTARGFATTSIASKPRAETLADDVASQSTGPSAQGTGNATPVLEHQISTPSPLQATLNGTSHERELKDLSPEELERQLEQSELQQLVERYAQKVRKEATRQLSRLETEKRLSRGQSEFLGLNRWVPEELRSRIEGLLRKDQSQPQNVPVTRLDQLYANEDTLLANLWTLDLVLQGIRVPQALAHQAILDLLSSLAVITDESAGTVWGMNEILEWLACYRDDDGGNDYDAATPAESVDTSENEKIISMHMQKEKSTQDQRRQGGRGAKKDASNRSAIAKAHQPDVLVSDSESDLEPEQMLSKYLDYKLRLFDADPLRFNDATSKSRKFDQSHQTSAQDRLLRRLRKIESDPLFDQPTADFEWSARRTEALKRQAEQRKMGIACNNALPTSNPAQDTQRSSADIAVEEASKLAEEVLQEDSDSDTGLFEGMFNDPTGIDRPIVISPKDSDGTAVTLRSFNKIEGYSPRRLLEETCKARDTGARLVVTMISETTYSCRHSVLIQWSKDQPVKEAPFLPDLRIRSTKRALLLEMVEVAASGTEQSEGFACTAAFFALFDGSPKEEKASIRLPVSFRDLYQEFSKAKQNYMDSADRNVISEIRLTIQDCKARANDRNTVDVSGPKSRSKQNSGATTPEVNSEATTAPTQRLDLANLWKLKADTPTYQAMLEFRSTLPMYSFRHEALEAVRHNQVVILCGETGCGKSTQMPAFILEDQMSQGLPCRIYCTEPRRISAVSLAQRVSEELGEDKNAVGTSRSLVGYAIRLESQTVASTRLIYATVGIVLRMLESQDGLKDLTHLIIDEVHERSIDTDFLLIVLKTLLVQRPDLKVILMSATVDASRFSSYLGHAPIIDVPGRTFPVRDLYLEDAIELTGYTNEDSKSARSQGSDGEDMESEDKSTSQENVALQGYSKSTLKTLTAFDEYKIDYGLIVKLLELLANDSGFRQFNKAVLIFLPGIAEIRQLTDMLAGHPMFSKGWLLYPLHSTFSNEEQQAAFRIPPTGMRKVVLATNIAETGITIPDVTCVIDTGKHKEMRFDEKRQLSRLITSFISRANAKQRRGRAGRVQEGVCFHLFTRHRHDKMMAQQQLPEMLRLSLQDLVIRVKICKLGEIEAALSEALDPPSVKNIRRAIDALIEVGALTSREELTAMGQQIAKLPLDAQLGKLILLGNIFGCLDFAITTAAIASSKSPFLTPLHARTQADTIRLGFKRSDSDLLTAYNAYETWRRVCTSPGVSEFDFCRKNFLSQQNLSNIEELKGQLLMAMTDAGLVSLSAEERSALSRIRHSKHRRNFISVPPHTTSNENNDSLISSVVAWSFYPKVVVREGKGWRSIANNQSLSLHRSSVNFMSPSPTFEKAKYLSFYSIMQATSRFTNAQETTPVDPMALVLLAGDARFDFYSGVIVIDGNRLRFKVRTWRDIAILKALRTKVKGVLAKAWKNPGREMTAAERDWFEIFMEIFMHWDEARKERS